MRSGAGWTFEAVAAQTKGDGRPYHEFLRVDSMSAGVYVLAPGATDGQSPHREDEIYLVVRGRARFRQGDDEQEVGPGSVLFVPAGKRHAFYDVAEELVTFVAFSPPESLPGPSKVPDRPPP